MGRPKGSVNKRSIALESELYALGVNLPERVVALLNSETLPENGGLTDRDRLNGYLELLQYVYPKRKSIEVEDVTKDKSNQIFVLKWADDAADDDSSIAQTNPASKENKQIP